MVKGARKVSKVFSRGFLIRAAERFAMIPVSLIVAAKATVEVAGTGGMVGMVSPN